MCYSVTDLVIRIRKSKSAPVNGAAKDAQATRGRGSSFPSTAIRKHGRHKNDLTEINNREIERLHWGVK